MNNLNINTTQSISKASTALKSKCEDTEKNMDKLLADAGCTEPEKVKRVKTLLPLIPGSGDDVVFVGLNGTKFYFQRGKSLNIPEPVLEIMQNTGVL